MIFILNFFYRARLKKKKKEVFMKELFLIKILRLKFTLNHVKNRAN